MKKINENRGNDEISSGDLDGAQGGGGRQDCNSRFIFSMHDIEAESIETRGVL